MSPASRAEERAVPRLPGKAKSSLVSVPAAFAVLALGFFASTLYGEIRASEIDREAFHIEANALPSVEDIVVAEAALRRLQAAIEEYAHGGGDERRSASRAIDLARADLRRGLAAEEATDNYPGEVELAAAADRSLDALDVAIARMHDLAASDPAAAKSFAEHEVRSAIDDADAALDRVLALNAAAGRVAVKRIAGLRATSVRVALGLDVACILLSALAAFVTIRALRRQRVAELAHERVLETRAQELEISASRVAHDLLSPLSALAFTLSAVKRNGERGAPIDEPLLRANACLKRSRRLVDAVLEFARSAASPRPGEWASLREAIDSVLDDVRSGGSEEEARGESPASDVALLMSPPSGDPLLACSPAILASVLSNLVRNAVKYIGDGDEDGKRVTILALPGGAAVRVEVEDNGPGPPRGARRARLRAVFPRPRQRQTRARARPRDGAPVRRGARRPRRRSSRAPSRLRLLVRAPARCGLQPAGRGGDPDR